MQHERDMKAKKKSTRRDAKLPSWRVSLLRKQLQYLGTVEAANEKAAEAAARLRNLISATNSGVGS